MSLLSMDSRVLVLSVFIFSCTLASFIAFANVTSKSVKNAFNYFKEKYKKVYKSAKETESALASFAKNYELVEALNDNTTAKNVIYAVNEYADIDADEFEDKHAITIMTYSVKELHKGTDQKLINRQKNEKNTLTTVRNGIKNKPIDTYDDGMAQYENIINNKDDDEVFKTYKYKEKSKGKNKKTKINADLYDLNNAQNLYNDFMKKYKKKNSTNEYDRYVHYMRFVKTLVEINRKRHAGEKAFLDGNADVIKEPDKLYY